MLLIAAIAACYGAANGIITIVRGFMVPEMISRDAYGAELCWNLGDEADQAALCGFNSMTSIPSWNLAPAMSFGN